MMESDSDNFLDDFADLDDVDWDQILPVAPNIHNSNPTNSLPEPASPESSVYDFSDVFYDPATLAQIDELERQAMNQERAPAQLGIHLVSGVNRYTSGGVVDSSSSAQMSRYFNGRDPTMGVSSPDEQKKKDGPKRRRRSSSQGLATPSKRNKTMHKSISSVEDIEDEFMCPICCDIFAVSHAANPCGHSFCGSCGEQWILENKNDRCPICRAKLAKDNPTIPNITLDNVIEKYIQILAKSGATEWTKGGAKLKEWTLRKEYV
ncbi:hypothetical protein F5887DRAFT_1070419 [Amanita rubescens]|nr:hypothetical protein F5887DRAFT_1070419 [Amanita rubescens]